MAMKVINGENVVKLSGRLDNHMEIEGLSIDEKIYVAQWLVSKYHKQLQKLNSSDLMHDMIPTSIKKMMGQFQKEEDEDGNSNNR